MTNAVFMPYVLTFNDKAIAERMSRLAMWLGLKTHGMAGIIDWLLRLREDIGVPHKLAGLKSTARGSTRSLPPPRSIQPRAATR